MSDIIYNQIGINDKPYKKGMWQQISLHDDKNIKGFFGDYRFLSNMWPAKVFGYPSVENAYMAAKIIPEERSFFKNCAPMEAKKKWREFKLLDKTAGEWDNRKYDVMALLVFEKFRANKDLRDKLLETGSKYLEEANWWRDLYWGVDHKLGGDNNLGKILMKVRGFWK